MKTTTLAALAVATGFVAGCAQSLPNTAPTADGFKTQQVIIGDGNPYATSTACPTVDGQPNTLCATNTLINPLLTAGYVSPWLAVMPQYSARLIGASFGYPFFGGYGYSGYGGNWLYGGYGYGGYGGYGRYGGYGGYGGHHRGGHGGIAEQNDVAYRPVGSKIWKPK